MNKITVGKVNTLLGHNDSIYTLAGIDNTHFISGAGDGLVVLWDLESPENGTLIAKVPTSIYALVYNQKRKQIILGQNYEGIHFIDITSKAEIKSLKINDSAIFDIQYSEDKIFVASGTGEVFVISWEENTIVYKIEDSKKSARSIAINQLKNEIAVGYSDHIVRIYDLNNYSLKHELKKHKNSVFTVKYNKAGDQLISAGRDASFIVWNVHENYKEKKLVVAHMYAVNNIQFSPNGKYFVTCSMDKSIKIWDSETFKLLKVIDKARHAGHGTSVNKLFWSSYQDQLVSCSDDRTISLWDINFE